MSNQKVNFLLFGLKALGVFGDGSPNNRIRAMQMYS